MVKSAPSAELSDSLEYKFLVIVDGEQRQLKVVSKSIV